MSSSYANDGLFAVTKPAHPEPLAHLLRPKILDDIVGQTHLLHPQAPLRKLVAAKKMANLLFWGPPGIGKTSLAQVLCHAWGATWEHLNATLSSVSDIKKVIENARHRKSQTVLFIDEIHRFSKTQQDALLSVVEDGTLILMGATTENPRFSVISGLLSRCLVFECKPLQHDDMQRLLTKASTHFWTTPLSEPVQKTLIAYAAGDGRKLCNAVALVEACGQTPDTLDIHTLQSLMPDLIRALDDTSHYDMASALIKSMRGSDPQAAIYWLARLLEAGEDPVFVARRLVIFASEDIGNADPQALPLATASMHAAQSIGMPEARIPLAQAVTYLACAPKSNAAYVAINSAIASVRDGDIQPIPPHLRSRQSQAMAHDKADPYKYPHDYPYGIVKQQYHSSTSPFYVPKNIGFEREIIKRLEWIHHFAEGQEIAP